MNARNGRNQRKTFALPVAVHPCVVCGTRDLRALVSVELPGGESVALCGSHELMHRRTGSLSSSIAELKANLGDRRAMTRRGMPHGEVDELAERLTAAFTNERRGRERRAS